MKSWRFLFTTWSIQMELTRFYYIYYCLPQEQAYNFTFLMHACKWKWSLLCYCLQACLDKSFISLDSNASIQSALCPQNLILSVYITKRVESGIIKLKGKLHHNCICWHTCFCTSKYADLLKPLTLTSHSVQSVPWWCLRLNTKDWASESTNGAVSILLTHLHSVFENFGPLLPHTCP